MRTKLAISPVHFNEEEHIYTLCGKRLSGVTSIINKYLFPDKYSRVSKSVLDAAASHGSLVHKQIETLINSKWTKAAKEEFLNTAEPEVLAFVDFVKQNKVKPVCAEYLVNDDHVASMIDLVTESENDGYDLNDHKTTSTHDKEYVRWQLSIYAHYFELLNQGKHVNHLYVYWLKGNKCEREEVERISDDIVRQLLTCYVIGADIFYNPLNDLGDDESELLAMLKDAQRQRKYYEEIEKGVLDTLRDRMGERHTNSIVKDRYKITLSADSKTIKFDEKAFKEARPAMWGKYLKETTTKGRLTVTFAKDEDNSADS